MIYIGWFFIIIACIGIGAGIIDLIDYLRTEC